MKTFKVIMNVLTLVGQEEKTVDVEAANEASAKKKAAKIMGNRDYDIVQVVELFKK